MAYNLRGRDPRPHRLEIRMTESEMDTLNGLCQLEDRTASAIVRAALSEYAEKVSANEQKQRDATI